jgi:hypothetical protein
MEEKYTQQKLLDFIKLASKTCKKEEEDMRQYYRKFLILSKPLLDSQELTKQEQDSKFWYGFHPDDHDELTTHLFVKYLDQPRRWVFNFEDVYQVMWAVLSGRPLFPSCWQDWQEETTRWHGHGQWNEDKDEDRDKNEDPRRYDSTQCTQVQESHSYGCHAREQSWEENASCNDTHNVKTKVVWLKGSLLENKEAKELLDQMDHLSLHDCAYASLHVCCILHYPHLAKSLANPEVSAATTSFSYQAMPLPPPIASLTYTYQATLPSQPCTVLTYSYQAPPPPLPPARQPWAPVPTPMPHQSPPPISPQVSSTHIVMDVHSAHKKDTICVNAWQLRNTLTVEGQSSSTIRSICQMGNWSPMMALVKGLRLASTTGWLCSTQAK